MTTHQANNRTNYDVEIILDSQSIPTKSLEDDAAENFISASDCSFSNRQFRFYKRQKQKNIEDELEENADKKLKDLGLYEDGMSKQQKLELLNIIAESQQLAEKVENIQEENEKWEEELLRQSADEKSPSMEIIEDDSTQSPVFAYCNTSKNHSDDEIPAVQYDNDTVPGSQDLFISKPADSSGSSLHSPGENLEIYKSNEETNFKALRKVRIGFRKRKLCEISDTQSEENMFDREMEVSSPRKFPSKQQDVDYQAINVWNSREEDSSKLKISCKIRKQLERHTVPYFTPKGMTPHTQADIIVQDLENYFKLLHEAQNEVLNHIPWGDPVSVGRHHRGTLDMINNRTSDHRKYLESKDADIDSDGTASIDDETDANKEQKEDPFILNAIPLKEVDENEFHKDTKKVSISEEFSEGDIFEEDTLPSLGITEESSVFLQTKEMKTIELPFHENGSDVSSECSGKSETSNNADVKKCKNTRSKKKKENENKISEKTDMEEIKNTTDSEEAMSGFLCTPPKKFKPCSLNELDDDDDDDDDFIIPQQESTNIVMKDNEENEITSREHEKSQEEMRSQLNLHQTSATSYVSDKKNGEAPSLEVFNPIPEMEISNDSDLIACPLCAVYFPKSQIETHASECNGVDDYSVMEMPVPKRTPKNKDRCYVCQNFFPKSKYEAHVKACIASTEKKTDEVHDELPICLPSLTSKSTTGSRLLDGLAENEDSASTSKAVEFGSFSPIKTFQPITNQNNSLLDYHNQFRHTNVRQTRTKSDTNLNSKVPARKFKKKRKQ